MSLQGFAAGINKNRGRLSAAAESNSLILMCAQLYSGHTIN